MTFADSTASTNTTNDGQWCKVTACITMVRTVGRPEADYCATRSLSRVEQEQQRVHLHNLCNMALISTEDSSSISLSAYVKGIYSFGGNLLKPTTTSCFWGWNLLKPSTPQISCISSLVALTEFSRNGWCQQANNGACCQYNSCRRKKGRQHHVCHCV